MGIFSFLFGEPKEGTVQGSAVVNPEMEHGAASTAATASKPHAPAGGPAFDGPTADRVHNPSAEKKKICCSCPDTKKLRDNCVAERGEDHAYCQALIEAHKACLRVEGFKV